MAGKCEGGFRNSGNWRSPSDPVAKALQASLGMSAAQDRMDTHAAVVVLEKKCTEVRTKDQAGYFIRVWRELRDQVRKIIGKDSRYKDHQG